MKSTRFILILTFASVIVVSRCTKLKENVGANITRDQVAKDSTYVTDLLQSVYSSLEWTFTGYLEIFALSELTTDEAIAPTRGNNWDDNGQWRVLHQHKYDPNNDVIHKCFNSLSGTVYAATDMLQYKPNVRQQAEARFLRAWAMFWLLDMFDQVPYRDPGESTVGPARVRKGIDALNYIISEIGAVQAYLPDGPADKANKYAAKVLLMKCYLNKGVYMNRANPVFATEDMNMVIKLADSVISSNKFSLDTNYYDNFSPFNSAIAKENIFTQMSNSDGNYQIAMAWSAVLSYPQHGYNGFSTLSDFYSKFEPTDKRRGIVYDYPNAPPNPGRRINVGFLIGPQYDLSLDTLLASSYTNKSNPLPVIFTSDVQNIEPGPNIEMPGIRPIKYPPDYLNYFPFNSPPTNEFVYFRFPDVLLMKAEAIFRGGTGTPAGSYGSDALSLVNSIRTNSSRGATKLSTINDSLLLDERGRELWWENWRRQDLIRFGQFRKPFQGKDGISDQKYLLFPIAYEQLGVNPYLKQNPGY